MPFMEVASSPVQAPTPVRRAWRLVEVGLFCAVALVTLHLKSTFAWHCGLPFCLSESHADNATATKLASAAELDREDGKSQEDLPGSGSGSGVSLALPPSSSAPPTERQVGLNNKPLTDLSIQEFMDKLEPCVPRLMEPAKPPVFQHSMPGLGTVFVVHSRVLFDREARVAKTLENSGFSNWSFIDKFDGPAIHEDEMDCFFRNVSSISGGSCCNRMSSVLKPHLAFYTIVKEDLPSALILEDDLNPLGNSATIQRNLARAVGMLRTCELVKVADYAVGYLVSNAGARKLLHYSLRRGGERIMRPQDWQLEQVKKVKYRGYRQCIALKIFRHYGHGTNQGGSE